MANVDSSVNMTNPTASAPVALPRKPVKSAEQVVQVKSSEPDVNPNRNPKYSVAEMSKSAAVRKLESVQQLEKSMDDLKAAAKKLDEAVKEKSINLNFSVDEASRRFIVEVKDSETGELVRQIPGDAVLRTAASLESLKGVLFDDVY